jgi:hypothetical protein
MKTRTSIIINIVLLLISQPQGLFMKVIKGEYESLTVLVSCLTELFLPISVIREIPKLISSILRISLISTSTTTDHC